MTLVHTVLYKKLSLGARAWGLSIANGGGGAKRKANISCSGE